MTENKIYQILFSCKLPNHDICQDNQCAMYFSGLPFRGEKVLTPRLALGQGTQAPGWPESLPFMDPLTLLEIALLHRSLRGHRLTSPFPSHFSLSTPAPGFLFPLNLLLN